MILNLVYSYLTGLLIALLLNLLMLAYEYKVTGKLIITKREYTILVINAFLSWTSVVSSLILIPRFVKYLHDKYPKKVKEVKK